MRSRASLHGGAFGASFCGYLKGTTRDQGISQAVCTEAGAYNGGKRSEGNFQEAAWLATRFVSLVIGRIEALGLRVALDKKGPCCSMGPVVGGLQHLQRGQLGPRTGLGTDEVSAPDPRWQVALRRALPIACSEAGCRCLCTCATFFQFEWSQHREKTASVCVGSDHPE